MINPEKLLAARDKGRSWDEIGEMFGLTVGEIKAAIAPLKAERRRKASLHPDSEKRLAAPCAWCRHALKEHGEYGNHQGQPCQECGPERYVWIWWQDDDTIYGGHYESAETKPHLSSRMYALHQEFQGCNEWEEGVPIYFKSSPEGRKKRMRKLRTLSILARRAARNKL